MDSFVEIIKKFFCGRGVIDWNIETINKFSGTSHQTDGELCCPDVDCECQIHKASSLAKTINFQLKIRQTFLPSIEVFDCFLRLQREIFMGRHSSA